MNVFQTIPETSSITQCAGSTIDFSVRINDFDKASCSAGTFEIDFPNSNYEFTFSTTSTNATFSGGGSSVTVGTQFVLPMANPLSPGTVNITASQNATLQISSSWNGTTPIRVDVTIKDLGGTLPSCHSGNPVDPDVTQTWVITGPTSIPTSAVRTDLKPKEDTWTKMKPSGLVFTYKGLPDSPPAYNGLAVTEVFSAPLATGIFTMADIKPSWISSQSLPLTINANQIAAMLFFVGNPNSFTFNTDNKFDDTHGGFALQPGFDPVLIFTQDAINNKRFGYRIDQDFICCGNTIMTNNQISRRADAKSTPFVIELKKKH